MSQSDGSPSPVNNTYLTVYNSGTSVMKVITQLYYEMFVLWKVTLPALHERSVEGMQHTRRLSMWTGGRGARHPAQPYMNSVAPAPPLTIRHVLEVMDWLFEEVITGTMGKNSLKDRCYLTRLHAVDAQQTAVLKLKHTKHRPYDMLAAIFLAASAMPATEEQKSKLRHYRYMFMHMYLTTSADFDYQDKDVYQHLPHAQLMQRKEQLERIEQLHESMHKIYAFHALHNRLP